MKYKSLTRDEVIMSREKDGNNALTQIPGESLLRKFINGFKDPMILILLAALVIQAVLFALGQAEWFEPFGIFVAIIIANGVSAVSEKKQEGKASALKAESESGEMSNVIRDDELARIHVTEIVKGDIVVLQAGDKIPADGFLVEGSIAVDQAALNGETEEAKKISVTDEMWESPDGLKTDEKDLLNPYYIYRGTVVCGGECKMLVSKVGDKTLFGQLALEVQEETRKTPLQLKLAKLAKQISVFGYVGAICIVAGILGQTLVSGNTPEGLYEWIRLIIDAVTVSVTIIVCAVPEGLPLLTSILMSFQSLKMAKDNVLVRKLNGPETSGSLNILFTDKTGTITEGRLTVVEIATGNVVRFHRMSDLSPELAKETAVGIGINNSAAVAGDEIVGGNSTDRALMSFLMDFRAENKMNKDEVRDFNAFDSNKKSSSVTIDENGKSVTYIKGAPEIILEKTEYYLNEKGERKNLNEINYLTSYLDSQAGRSMRLLAVAKYEEALKEEGYTLICVISIRDSVRAEVVDAVEEVKSAGISVVMVTGDRKETAAAIAYEAGLISSEKDIILTSSELGEKSDEELKAILPRLKVVARALPSDKSRLVRIAQEMDLVVGMTGDGVNDSPALKKADVGFAMGSGTEVAKEAGDITILDDNFSSIEKAILYGRTMFKSIRKFLVFQLTVNISAVLICFIGPLLGVKVVFTVVQLLMVNLVMDTLAAIAFGSEPAINEYMREKPVPRNAGIINKQMFGQIIVSALYITLICLGILFIPPVSALFGQADIVYLRTAAFAVFMMAVAFNGFNARTGSINLLKNIGKNKSFICVMLLVFVLQFVFITFGGKVLSVSGLSAGSWLICLGLAFLIIPIDLIRKLIVRSNV